MPFFQQYSFIFAVNGAANRELTLKLSVFGPLFSHLCLFKMAEDVDSATVKVNIKVLFCFISQPLRCAGRKRLTVAGRQH